ncbi:MAG: glycerol-3-phosphate dehydrogenase [Geminicoccaceae bacterium]
MSEDRPVDLLVVGGGINGVGIARDAAGRGLSVILVERDDLASHTSSWSSKLIHGGLRYLEHYEFRLVREALIEREVLLRAAPHLVGPLTFVLPHAPEMRPTWLIRLGLILYDNLGGRERLPRSRGVDLSSAGAYGDPLQDWVTRGFTYADCRVDDSRLVVANAIDARERGAEILTRTECVRARRVGDLWEGELEGGRRVRARALVNAAGPWVDRMLDRTAGAGSDKRVRLVKGSHIVVPALYPADHAYILQNDDGRIVFVIPYQGRFSLIGTTDIAYEGEPADVAISAEETEYLCRIVNRYFRRKVVPTDVVWSFSGVRPLYDDAKANVSAVTRDYVFDLEAEAGKAPLLSIFGGKLTTYRKLAEHAMEKLQPVMGFTRGPWTAKATLPGGDLPDLDPEAYAAGLRQRMPWLPNGTARRWALAYGTRTEKLMQSAKGQQSLGERIAEGLYEAELDYLVREEWARSGEDVLWRRTKLGLHVGKDVAGRIDAWIARQGNVHPALVASAR